MVVQNKLIRDLPFEKRCEIIKDLNNKYSDRIPLYIMSGDNKKKSAKLLVPYDLSIMDVLYILKKRVDIRSEESLYLYIHVYCNSNSNKIKEYIYCNTSETISELYNKYKDDDNMLYMSYHLENTFG